MNKQPKESVNQITNIPMLKTKNIQKPKAKGTLHSVLEKI